jgi:two-component system, chemotaxis family, CheB/CheR fusion protein
MQIYQSAILDALGSGVMVLDEEDIVVVENDAMNQLWGLRNVKLAGKRIQETSFAARCKGLVPRLAESRKRNEATRFVCDVQQGEETRRVQMTLRPIEGDKHQRHGTLILADDVSHRERLQKTIEQLEATGEELQSANEELETTNEELQSTNEQLETTNEELQSTNEELETTNEQLQSLNEELENMNEELEYRTRELDSLNSRYADTLEQMPWPIINTDKNGRVQFWNSAAERLFNLPMRSVVGLELGQLPIPQTLRKALGSKFKTAVNDLKQVSVPGNGLRSKELGGKIEITITPLARDGSAGGALIMFAANSGDHSDGSKKTVKRPAKKPGKRRG